MAGKTLMYIIPTLMAAATAAPHEARKIETGETVYAYGMGGITGYPVYADFDGFAVIAASGSDTSGLSNITWSIDTTGASSWDVSLNGTNDTASFYIIPDGDGYVQAGFTVNGTTPVGAQTLGFVLYGSDIMFKSGDTYLYQFWAQNTSTGQWNLTWNTDGDSEDGSVPVMLKPEALSLD